MARRTSLSQDSLTALAEKLADLRSTALTEDEDLLLKLNMEGKTDAQVAAVFGISVPVTNQKKHKLYSLINGLGWWQDNKSTILETLTNSTETKSTPARSCL